MTSAAVVARLNPKSARFDGCAGGSDGSSVLTPEMIAGALAGLSELAVKLALVKYAGQAHEVSRLLYWTRDAAVDLAIKHQWGLPKPGQLAQISRYAIWQCIDPKHCATCSGAGNVMDQWRHSRPCVHCKGVGTIETEDTLHAEIAGFDIETWRNTWARRAGQLAECLFTADRQVRVKLHFELSEI